MIKNYLLARDKFLNALSELCSRYNDKKLLACKTELYKKVQYIRFQEDIKMDKKIISTEKAPQAIGPYSQAIVANGFLFTSGMVPIDPATNQLVEGDITVQAKQAISNLKNLIEASGSSCDKVVKTTVFIKDMNQFSIINDIYKEYFNKDFPARSCVEVARLPKDVLIEIEAVAVV